MDKVPSNTTKWVEFNSILQLEISSGKSYFMESLSVLEIFFSSSSNIINNLASSILLHSIAKSSRVKFRLSI